MTLYFGNAGILSHSHPISINLKNIFRQLLGGPSIACDGFPPQRERFAEDWCWAKGIYTLKEAYEMETVVSPYPG